MALSISFGITFLFVFRSLSLGKFLLKVTLKKNHVTALACSLHMVMYKSLLLKFSVIKQNMVYIALETFKVILSNVDCCSHTTRKSLSRKTLERNLSSMKGH